jgi:hypothetical protein
MLQWGKDKFFEDRLKKPLKKLSNKQIAQFALICTIRALPLLSVKRFKQWEIRKIQAYLINIFMTIDLCAGYIQGMLNNNVNLFLTEVPSLVDINENNVKNYVKNNPMERKADNVYAAAYVMQAVSYLTETVHFFNNIFADSEDMVKKAKNVVCSVDAAFEKVYTGHNAYFVIKFHEFLESDVYRILNNEDHDNDFSLYNDLWEGFIDDLRMIGLSYWADVYDVLFYNNFQFDEMVLSSRVIEHEELIEAIHNAGRPFCLENFIVAAKYCEEHKENLYGGICRRENFMAERVATYAFTDKKNFEKAYNKIFYDLGSSSVETSYNSDYWFLHILSDCPDPAFAAKICAGYLGRAY